MMMATQASKIKSFDAAIEADLEEAVPKSQLKTSLSMSNILQHQQEHERLVKKKMKKKKKAASKNNKKAKKSKESLIKPAEVQTKLEACISTEEIETAYAADPAAAHSQSPRGGRARGLSRSSPSPTSSTTRLGPAHGGAWSDADDEILEFVREETPLDRRSVGPVSAFGSGSSSGSVVVATSTTTTTSTTASPALPSKKGKNKGKGKSKKKKQQQLHNKNSATDNDGGSGGKKNGSSSTSASSGNGNMVGTSTPRSQDDEFRSWDAREAADEEDEEVEAFDKEEEEDTDEESGSCSSRYGWQFKNDKRTLWSTSTSSSCLPVPLYSQRGLTDRTQHNTQQ